MLLGLLGQVTGGTGAAAGQALDVHLHGAGSSAATAVIAGLAALLGALIGVGGALAVERYRYKQRLRDESDKQASETLVAVRCVWAELVVLSSRLKAAETNPEFAARYAQRYPEQLNAWNQYQATIARQKGEIWAKVQQGVANYSAWEANVRAAEENRVSNKRGLNADRISTDAATTRQHVDTAIVTLIPLTDDPED